MKPKLRPIEADVLNMIGEGYTLMTINRKLKRYNGFANNIVSKLVSKGVLEREKLGQYRLLTTEFEIIDEVETKPGVMSQRLAVLPEMEQFLRQNYRKRKRSELAREIGISRYELNMILLQIGLGS